MGWLSLAIWTPIVFGAVLLALGRDSQAQLVRWIALIGSVVSLLITLRYSGHVVPWPAFVVLWCLLVIAWVARTSSPLVRGFGDDPRHVNTWVLYLP